VTPLTDDQLASIEVIGVAMSQRLKPEIVRALVAEVREHRRLRHDLAALIPDGPYYDNVMYIRVDGVHIPHCEDDPVHERLAARFAALAGESQS
jgi:hypothetical protein